MTQVASHQSWECDVCRKRLDDGKVASPTHDDALCDICRTIDLDEFFTKSNIPVSPVTRSYSHISDHQDCSLCKLTRYALQQAGEWDETSAKWAMFAGAGSGSVYYGVGSEGKDRPRNILSNFPANYIEIRILNGPQLGCGSTRSVNKFDSPRIQLLGPRSKAKSYPKNKMLLRYVKMIREFQELSPDDQKVLGVIPQSLFCARPIPDLIWFELPRNRLRHCEETHPQKCQPSKLKDAAISSFDFRVIDVRNGCVVDAPADCRFICLSYTWGAVPQSRLLEETKTTLFRVGGLHSETLRVGQTILDAVTCCDRMGERYLWVDALCIMQDDPEDLRAHIANMGAIYSAAVLTIVAAAGSDADAGLPGVRPGTRSFPQIVGVAHGYELVTGVPEVRPVLTKSAWSSRGWTFQEDVLSTRMLGFTEHQTYFKCGFDAIDEDTIREGDYGPIPLFDDKTKQAYRPGKRLSEFTDFLDHYSKRKLSYPIDALNAFTAIISLFGNEIDGEKNEWLCGMPSAAFGWALCWMSLDPDHRRRPEFPSWSWAGWYGEMSMNPGSSNAAHNGAYSGTLGIDKDVRASGMFGRLPVDEVLFEKHGFDIGPRDGFVDRDSSYLTFKTTATKLKIDRETHYDHYYRNHSYFVRNSYDDNSHFVRTIHLNSEWRDRQPDELDFIAIHVIANGSDVNVYYMCVEWHGDICFRVQMGEGAMSDKSWIRARPKQVSVTMR